MALHNKSSYTLWSYSRKVFAHLYSYADNWRNERSSNAFYLGEILYIKASYGGPDYESRRLFVDNCVATLDPDVTSLPRYYFIENHG